MIINKTSKGFLLIISLILFVVGLYYTIFTRSEQYKFETIWGETIYLDKNLKPLIDTSVMKRIKDVDQSGPSRYFGPKLPKFTRFEHSLGVVAIVSKVTDDRKEQAAALLHDVSHTVFSHVADHLFTDAKKIDKYAQNSYQDTTHMSYLDNPEIHKIIETLGVNYEDLSPDKEEYKALEQPLPDMCADRIEYNLHTAILLKLITKKEAKTIMDNLKYHNEKWVFIDKDSAVKLAEASLHFTQNFWGSKWNTSINIHFAAALRRALAIKIINQTDLYLTDSVVMRKLIKNQDKVIQTYLQQCEKPLNIIPGQQYVIVEYKPKFRGIDPLILDEKSGELKRLSEIDVMFKSHYDNVKEWCKSGYDINILKDAI